MGKKYEYVIIDRKRILLVHNVTEEDVGIYECVLGDDRMSLQLTLKGMFIKSIATKYSFTVQLYRRTKSTVCLPLLACEASFLKVSPMCSAPCKGDLIKGTGLSVFSKNCLKPT